MNIRRRKFHRRVYLDILRRQRLLCACGCGVKLSRKEGYQFDHDSSLGLGGADSPENLHALRTPCHAKKTRTEATIRAKADRQRKSWLGLKKRRGPKLQGRGWDKRLRRRFDGTVEVRA